ncbi:MAG: hypothetical protein HY565_02960 [Candidatus Kerfeldbacteria bacterium]|nr:hypothetical protein [Candidatus Kerfeldbacteria bacterium]
MINFLLGFGLGLLVGAPLIAIWFAIQIACEPDEVKKVVMLDEDEEV